MHRICALLLAVLALTFVGAAKKKPQVTVRFHSETTQADGEKFGTSTSLKTSQKEAFISKVPDISERDIVAIYPFPADDGTSGCAFQLDAHGRLALETMSNDKRGRFVIALVNGRHVIDMLIDRRVSDGIITISRGLTETDVAALQKAFPIIGQDRKKK